WALGIDDHAFSRNGTGCRDDQLSVGRQVLSIEIVHAGNRSLSGVVLSGDGGQGVSGFDFVVTPNDAFIFRNSGDSSYVLFFCTFRNAQFERLILGSGPAQ